MGGGGGWVGGLDKRTSWSDLVGVRQKISLCESIIDDSILTSVIRNHFTQESGLTILSDSAIWVDISDNQRPNTSDTFLILPIILGIRGPYLSLGMQWTRSNRKSDQIDIHTTHRKSQRKHSQ